MDRRIEREIIWIMDIRFYFLVTLHYEQFVNVKLVEWSTVILINYGVEDKIVALLINEKPIH